MATIQIDTQGFARKYQTEPESRRLGLWTFQIQQRDVNFWGRYEEVRNIVEKYATSRGVDRDIIELVDCHEIPF
jgi:hypothetical protein